MGMVSNMMVVMLPHSFTILVQSSFETAGLPVLRLRGHVTSKKHAMGSWSGPVAGHISRGNCNQICWMYVVRRSLAG